MKLNKGDKMIKTQEIDMSGATTKITVYGLKQDPIEIKCDHESCFTPEELRRAIDKAVTEAA